MANARHPATVRAASRNAVPARQAGVADAVRVAAFALAFCFTAAVVLGLVP